MAIVLTAVALTGLLDLLRCRVAYRPKLTTIASLRREIDGHDQIVLGRPSKLAVMARMGKRLIKLLLSVLEVGGQGVSA